MSNYLEKIFTIAALVFFSRVLGFESMSIPAEGLSNTTAPVTENPLSPFLSLMQHSIFLAVAVLLFLRGKQTIQALKRGKLIWLLLALAFLSFIWSNNPNTSFRGAFALMESCAFSLYFASNYSFQQQLQLLAIALGITSLISLFYTMAFPGYGIEDGIHKGAWRGPYIHKNILARILAFSCLIYLSLVPRRIWHQYLIFGGLALSMGLIIFSRSKTAIAVLILLFLLSRIYKSFHLKDLIAIPLVSTLLIFFSTITLVLITKAEVILNSIGKDLTLSGRTIIWSSLVEQIKLRPWFGYGYMGFWTTDEAKSIMTKLFGTTYVPSHSHNGYLELVTSFGLVGAILFTLTFIAIARRSIILMRWNQSSEGLWPILFLTFLLIYNLSEPTLIEHNSIFWIVYLSLALTRFIKFDQSEYLTSINTN